MRFCGIDLHLDNSVVVVTDETDKVLVSKRCPNDLQKILAKLAPHRGELAGVVVESTCATVGLDLHNHSAEIVCHSCNNPRNSAANCL